MSVNTQAAFDCARGDSARSALPSQACVCMLAGRGPLRKPSAPLANDCVAIDTNDRGVSDEVTPPAAERYDARVVASGQGPSLSRRVVGAGKDLRVTAHCPAGAARSVVAFRAGHSIVERPG
jgi:hypothetical protein